VFVALDAAGMQIMGQRLLDISTVRSAGHTLILQGGPRPDLYRDFVSQHGLGYTVRNLDRVGNRHGAALK